MKPPLVQDDDETAQADVAAIDSRQPKAGSAEPAGMIAPAAAPGTLKQRLSKKLSAIHAYLQSPDDLRLASPESSSPSLSGYAMSTAAHRPMLLHCLLLAAADTHMLPLNPALTLLCELLGIQGGVCDTILYTGCC